MTRYGHGHGHGHGHGFYPYWGGFYPTYLTAPILASNYRIGGLLNEYAELNDVAIRNNMIYNQNIASNYESRGRDINIYMPTMSASVAQSIVDSRPIAPYGVYPYGGFPYGGFPGFYPR